jgi:crossover junction endodeoxyribonuclease RuvC
MVSREPSFVTATTQGRPLRILGIDPGLHVTGYGVLDAGPKVLEAGVICSVEGTSKKASLEARILNLYNGLVEVMDQFRPQAVAVEQLYAHYQHPRTAILMAHARGLVFWRLGSGVYRWLATRPRG